MRCVQMASPSRELSGSEQVGPTEQNGWLPPRRQRCPREVQVFLKFTDLPRGCVRSITAGCAEWLPLLRGALEALKRRAPSLQLAEGEAELRELRRRFVRRPRRARPREPAPCLRQEPPATAVPSIAPPAAECVRQFVAAAVVAPTSACSAGRAVDAAVQTDPCCTTAATAATPAVFRMALSTSPRVAVGEGPTHHSPFAGDWGCSSMQGRSQWCRPAEMFGHSAGNHPRDQTHPELHRPSGLLSAQSTDVDTPSIHLGPSEGVAEAPSRAAASTPSVLAASRRWPEAQLAIDVCNARSDAMDSLLPHSRQRVEELMHHLKAILGELPRGDFRGCDNAKKRPDVVCGSSSTATGGCTRSPRSAGQSEELPWLAAGFEPGERAAAIAASATQTPESAAPASSAHKTASAANKVISPLVPSKRMVSRGPIAAVAGHSVVVSKTPAARKTLSEWRCPLRCCPSSEVLPPAQAIPDAVQLQRHSSNSHSVAPATAAALAFRRASGEMASVPTPPRKRPRVSGTALCAARSGFHDSPLRFSGCSDASCFSPSPLVPRALEPDFSAVGAVEGCPLQTPPRAYGKDWWLRDDVAERMSPPPQETVSRTSETQRARVWGKN